MKVTIGYYVTIDVDLPDNDVKEILNYHLDLEKVDAFNTLAQYYSPSLASGLAAFDNAEMTGVYNPCEYDEVLWEG